MIVRSKINEHFIQILAKFVIVHIVLQISNDVAGVDTISRAELYDLNVNGVVVQSACAEWGGGREVLGS